MITKLGEFLRMLRLNNGQILKEMADMLEVSSAFLSAVENGKKTMPKSWFEKLKEIYKLNEEQEKNLKHSELESHSVIELNLTTCSEINKNLAISFARTFENLDENTSGKILNLLCKESKKNE